VCIVLEQHDTSSDATRNRAEAPAAPAPEEGLARPVGRVLSSRQFWDLMERWRVPESTALELIGFPGKLRKDGKRPRFRFTTRQQRITSYLAEIDAALTSAGKDQTWLHRKIRNLRFSHRSPIEHMVGMGWMAWRTYCKRSTARRCKQHWPSTRRRPNRSRTPISASSGSWPVVSRSCSAEGGKPAPCVYRHRDGNRWTGSLFLAASVGGRAIHVQETARLRRRGTDPG
jgi:hypothetical protein